MLINPCDNCNLKGICPNIQIDQKIHLQKIECPQFEIYNREKIYPHKSSEINSWLKSGVMIDENLRIDKEELVDDIYMNLLRDSNFQNLHLYKESLSCILGNLVVLGNRNIPLSKPLEKNSKYNCAWFKQKIIDNIFKILVDNNYCLYWKGIPGQSAKYFLSSELINKYFNTKTSKPSKFILMNKTDPTDKRRISRSKKRKIYIDPPYCPMLRNITNDIEYINKLLGESSIKFIYNPEMYNRPEYEDQLELLTKCNYLTNKGNIYEINKDSLYLFRVFNRGDYIYGGRFYTKIFQGIPSLVRNTITINGEETIELDYSAHHLKLLYHKEGIDFNDEVYIYNKLDKLNADKRIIHKKIAMIAINAETRKSAIGAVKNAIEQDYINGKFKSSIPSFDQLNKFYDDFLTYHKSIAKYVGADIGIKLQRMDSDIMNNILVELTKNNIIALPVHDSVIVQNKFKDILKNEMIYQYHKYTKFYPTIS